MKVACALASSSKVNTNYLQYNIFILDAIIIGLIRLTLIKYLNPNLKGYFGSTKLIRAYWDIFCISLPMRVRVFSERIGQSLGLEGNYMA